ncbi:MAG: DUF3800 domain-containing protein [Rhodococcus qingshengii]|jgi:hypothetical protein|uniref:DUF3800 domain-containing protein n=1 Tax=Rhodococcus qingshengii JCM 15477 TaxID=1303681 RepID=A0AB38RNE8_RHOSG|nr:MULTISPECIES: DUF3800 domain-containing protein [Rhodococcus]MDN5585884.1 DUF3800 domain-containing protein [Brevibacterium sp.]MBO8150595.1 DUF3800 domain-containing protein [Rhodococcus erythropolis]MBW0291211.1 hypothetical protein [Rhodococcus sp. MH15]MDO1492882.1 DUF3800 domain-containing protein [Rhodococcus erythropolis]UPU46641.1 DUF3800 domain-containing protein [Rhodococcus qingshengii JCM 15477]
MLLAYIDEIGETGAFVARDHARFNTSPAFGYAGLILPADNARKFGQIFTLKKREIFKTEIEKAEHPGRWERKGASIFRPDTFDKYRQQIRVFNTLVRSVRSLDGALFYYAAEKPLGTPKQTDLDTDARETAAMREALNRIARYADYKGSNVMVMIDQINEKTRAARLPAMYEHILGRASGYPEMKRIIEPPMHIDSVLSSNIQFSDWIAACVTRAIEYQIIKESPYQWVTGDNALPSVRGAFTHESKIHLWQRDLSDLNHSDIFRSDRLLHPAAAGQLVGDQLPADRFRRMKAAAERAQIRQ